jgi:hypothetical protein
MLPGKPIDFSQNYEDLAEEWARRLDTSFGKTDHEVSMCVGLIEAFFGGVYPETIDAILIDPQAFAQRVSEYHSNLKNQSQEL